MCIQIKSIFLLLEPGAPGISSCNEVKVKVAQSCPTLCNPMNYTVHGILQARILTWIAFPFSSRSSRPRNLTRVSCIAGDSLPTEISGKPCNEIYCKCLGWILKRAYMLSCAGLFATPLDCSLQVPLSMGLFRQDYWSGLPFPSPGVLPDSGIKLVNPASPAWQVDILPLNPVTGEAPILKQVV